MSNFNTRALANDSFLVTGEDDAGRPCTTVLDGSELMEVRRESNMLLAGQEYDRVVEDFFAPLTAAADLVTDMAAPKPMDPAFLYVVDEGQEPVEGRRSHIHLLSHDSAVLRLLQTRQSHRLVWVKTPAEDRIEILEDNQPSLDSEDEVFQTFSIEEFFDFLVDQANDHEPASNPTVGEEEAEGLAREAFTPDDATTLDED